MMAISDLDEQFLDNNLLTDEDLQFDVSNTLEEVFKHTGLLDCIGTDFEFSRNMIPDIVEDNPVNMMDESVINFLHTSANHVEVKMEPLLPYSCRKSSISPESILPSETEITVLSTSELSENPDRLAIPDTPPHTPPSLSDRHSITLPNANSILLSMCTTTPICVTSPKNIQTSIRETTPCIPILKAVPSSDIKPKPFLKSVNGAREDGPLVLTPERFAMLTKGKLKVKSVCEVVSTASRNATILQPKNNVFMPAKGFLFQKNNDASRKKIGQQIHPIDITAIKRQQRMIKNRESACLSRKKKKEYMQRLENEVKEFSTINAKLQFENVQLKQQIGCLEKENASLKALNIELKSRVSPNFMKKTTGLMAVLFMVTLNLAPLSNLFDKPISTDIQKTSSQRIGRTLLWDEHLQLQLNDVNNSSSFSDLKGLTDGNISIDFMENIYSVLNATMCPTYINKTESERLENDLRGWVQRVEKKQNLKQSMKDSKDQSLKKGLPPLPKLQSRIRRKNENIKHHYVKSKILVYHTPRVAYEEFFDAINRRDDTFYFVSFSGDHLLLPATMHNQTLRPRMSLIMPAMTFNDSMGHMDDHVGMMQIDCEVMNTKLVYVKQSAIPERLRQNSNNTEVHMHKKSLQFSLNDKEHNVQKNEIWEPKYN